MSFSLDAVRKYGPPLEQKVNELSQTLAKVQSENQKVETDDVVGKSDSDHSLVRYYDNLYSVKKFDTSIIGTTGPKLVFEPDYNNLACWIRFNHTGYYLDDYSGFDNKAEIFGEPCLTDGIDLGYFGGPMHSVAHEADDTATIFYRIPDTAKLRVLGKATGFSIFVRCNLASLAQQNGRDITLYEKYDDASNAVSLRVDPTGVIKLFVRKAGTDYFSKTTTPQISAGVNTDIGATYTVSGNVRAIFTQGISKAVTTNAEAANWDTAYIDSIIWACSAMDKGIVYGKPMDFRFYDEKVLTQAMYTNLFTNKISISGALFGEVAVTDGSILPRLPIVPSFDDDSFTTTSFT